MSQTRNLQHSSIVKFVTLSVLTAVIVVLQLVAGTIKIGPVSFTLVLIPIVVGAAFYGKGAGAFLGAVFGIMAFIGCATGSDWRGSVLFAANPFICFLVCMGKGTLSGFTAGLVYRLVIGKSTSLGRSYVASLLAALAAPIVNTGLFCLSMVLFYHDVLVEWAGGSNLLNYVMFGLVGVNFLVETGINLVCSPAINTIVRAVRKSSH